MPVAGYYYSKNEWDRLGCGPLPPERDTANPENKDAVRKSMESMQNWIKQYEASKIS